MQFKAELCPDASWDFHFPVTSVMMGVYSCWSMNQNREKEKSNCRRLGWIIALGLCLGCRSSTPPNIASSQSFRVMTFNIHHGEGGDGKVDLKRIAEAIR